MGTPDSSEYDPNFDSYPAESPSQASPSQSNPWLSRLLILLIAAAVLPPLYRFGRGEIAKWHLASATSSLYRGDRAKALEKVNDAVSWSPNDTSLLATKASYLLANGNAKDAMPVATRALEIAQQQCDQRETPRSLGRLAQMLNLCAYTHALANENLVQSLEQSEQAIVIASNMISSDGMSSLLDTRGYLHYLVAQSDLVKSESTESDTTESKEDSDDATESTPESDSESTSAQSSILMTREAHLDQAMTDAEDAVQRYDQSLPNQRAIINTQARESVDQVKFEYELRMLNEGSAVLYHHRGQVYEALGKQSAADKDFRKAKELGYDPANGVW